MCGPVISSGSVVAAGSMTAPRLVMAQRRGGVPAEDRILPCLRRERPKAGVAIIVRGEVEVDETEADGGAVHGHRSGDQPVSGVEDSRSCARRVSHVVDLGTAGPSPRR